MGSFAFLVDKRARVNNDGVVDGNLGVNDPFRGFLRFGKRVFMTDGKTAAGDRIRLGDETSVYDILATTLFYGPTSKVRGSYGIGSFPLREPFCSLPEITCTSANPVTLLDNMSLALPQGSYGTLIVKDGATLTLADPTGVYDFCSVKVGRNSLVESTDRATINVVGDVNIGAGSKVWTPPVVNDLPLILNVAGTKVRISQGAIVEAAITAPDAKLKIQRGGALYGCFCTNQLSTDKQVLLECVDTPIP